MQKLEGFVLLHNTNSLREMAEIGGRFPAKAKCLPQNVKESFSSMLNSFGSWLFDSGLLTTKSLVTGLAAELDNLPFKAEALYQRIRAIDATFQAELGKHSFLYLDQGKAPFYDLAEPFGPAVAKSFPSASFDILEAAKCYALERPTGCVLHLMRVLEVGLSVFAKSLNLRFNEAAWGTILDKIEKRIRTIEKLKRKPKDWKKNRQFYSEAALDFRFLKDGWRNYAMHARQKYDEQEARNIYDHVSSFMRHLATKLKE